MKHLKKFNENVAEKYLQMHEILKDVFAELIDDTTIQVEFGFESDDSEILVTIKPYASNRTNQILNGPDEMVARFEKNLELVKDISVCYKRACDELQTEGKLMVAADNRIYASFKIPGVTKTEYPF
jgi:hypothetical protein